ncbi:hypothetical protein B0H17DRAFT_1220554 [Mycena rosella]|uniref:Uncharacterized protein n=1 Tax=Mycena rosella TaxID=1033263 RepID=A0AAD7BA15_MYCRO|nr:hypothetical protein B0H17DRAFT_1220554 [Mycena rosella]
MRHLLLLLVPVRPPGYHALSVLKSLPLYTSLGRIHSELQSLITPSVVFNAGVAPQPILRVERRAGAAFKSTCVARLAPPRVWTALPLVLSRSDAGCPSSSTGMLDARSPFAQETRTPSYVSISSNRIALLVP